MEFAPKPLLAKASQDKSWKSLFSLILFVATYYLIFDGNLFKVFIIVFVLFIHELGHYLTMKYFNYKDVSMFFVPLMGAYVSGEKENVSQKQKALVLLAGPLPGIIIGVLLIHFSAGNYFKELSYAGKTFIFINSFNLIPISPFDGGKLVEVLFISSREIIQALFTIFSILVMLLLLYYLEAFVFIVLIFIMGLQLRNTYMVWKMRREMSLKGITYKKSYDDLSDEEYWQIQNVVVKNISGLRNNNSNDIHDNRMVDWVKSSLQVPLTKDLSSSLKTIIVFWWVAGLIFAPMYAFWMMEQF